MRQQWTIVVEAVMLVDQENYAVVGLGGDGAASCLLHSFDAKTRVNIFEDLFRRSAR